MNEIISVGKYWVDHQYNKWDKEKYSFLSASAWAQTMVNSFNNINCEELTDCTDCKDSYKLVNCLSVIKCRYCEDLKYSYNAIHCSDGSWIYNSYNLIGYSYMNGFNDCNISQYNSNFIGSRNAITNFFYNEDATSIHCGCFRGSLDEFKRTVESKYGSSMSKTNLLYYTQYMKFISECELRVKTLRES